MGIARGRHGEKLRIRVFGKQMNELIVRPTTDMIRTGPVPGSAMPSPAEKAAIILSVLDPADASELLKTFDQKSLLKFAGVISSLKPVPSNIMVSVVTEFLTALGEETNVRGGEEQVRKLLSEFLEPDQIDEILSSVAGRDIRSVWDRLGDAPNTKAASFLQLEHPQTVAIVLSKVRPDKAARILEEMERNFAQTAVLRLSRIPTLNPDILKKVEVTIETEFLSAISRQSGSVKPSELIGDLMNNVSGSARDEFLENLGEVNQELQQEVLRVMFTFADIATRVEGRDVAKIVKAVEEEQLMIALKYAQDTSNPSFEFIMANLSKRLAERINEDVAAMESVKDKDGEAAHMAITNIIQKMGKTGELKLIEIEPD